MASQENKNLYEGMFIVSAKLSDDARNKALEKVQALIAEAGGESHKVHDLGRSRLAYQIDNHREGHYFLLYFSVIPQAITELWGEFHLSEDLIRFMTLRTDEVKEKIEFKEIERG